MWDLIISQIVQFFSSLVSKLVPLLCIWTSFRVRMHPEAGRTTFFQPFLSVFNYFPSFFHVFPLKIKEKTQKCKKLTNFFFHCFQRKNKKKTASG
jgi:hypothetical protein